MSMKSSPSGEGVDTTGAHVPVDLAADHAGAIVDKLTGMPPSKLSRANAKKWQDLFSCKLCRSVLRRYVQECKSVYNLENVKCTFARLIEEEVDASADTCKICTLHSHVKDLFDAQNHIHNVHLQGARCNSLYQDLGKFEAQANAAAQEYVNVVSHIVKRKLELRFLDSRKALLDYQKEWHEALDLQVHELDESMQNSIEQLRTRLEEEAENAARNVEDGLGDLHFSGGLLDLFDLEDSLRNVKRFLEAQTVTQIAEHRETSERKKHHRIKTMSKKLRQKHVRDMHNRVLIAQTTKIEMERDNQLVKMSKAKRLLQNKIDSVLQKIKREHGGEVRRVTRTAEEHVKRLLHTANAPLRPPKPSQRPLFTKREVVSHANKSSKHDVIIVGDVKTFIDVVLGEERKV